MVSGGPLSAYSCELETRGHPIGEGADISWICPSEVFGYHLKPEQRDRMLGSRGLYYTACPWKRGPTNVGERC